MLKIEAHLSVLKSYVNCELSTLTSKIESFSDLLENTLGNLQKRESNYANTDLIQQNITSLENELKSEDTIIQSLLETQNAFTNSLSNLKAKQPEPIVNLSQQQQRQHQKYYHHPHHHHHQQSLKTSTAAKPNITTFTGISKKSGLPPTKAAKFRERETNYSCSR